MTNIEINTNITLSSQQLLTALTQLTTAELEVTAQTVEHLLQQRQQKIAQGSSESIPKLASDNVDSLETDNLETDRLTNLPNTATLDIPIVESLIPKSFTIEGNRLST